LAALVFDGRQRLDCHTPIPFAEQPGKATRPKCSLRLRVTANGDLGRLTGPDWQPVGLQGRHR
jgi:hypothetical protein